MATKACIGILTTTTIAKTIEVAYEGYPEYTGELLKKHFTSSKAIRELLQKGDILQLEESLEAIKHDDLQGQAQTHRFFGSLIDLANQSLVDYSYFFIEADQTWVMVSGNEMTTL